MVTAHFQKHFFEGGDRHPVPRNLKLIEGAVKGLKQGWELRHLVKRKHVRQRRRRRLYMVESTARHEVCNEFTELLDRGVLGEGGGR